MKLHFEEPVFDIEIEKNPNKQENLWKEMWKIKNKIWVFGLLHFDSDILSLYC